MQLRKDPSAAFGNALLSALPQAEYERLAPHLELVRLTAGKVLNHADDIVRYAYFPKGGLISLVSTTEDGRAVEVGMIGNEGMAGIPIILRSSVTANRVTVQLGGNALRIRGSALREEFNRCGKLQDLLLRYTNSLFIQMAQSAACNRFHTAKQRLCRWLLTSHDRVKTDTLQLTQEFISQMLGLPRTNVTTIASDFQKKGLISYSRGKITILDRKGMEAASCECYRRVWKETSDFLVA